MSMKTNHQLPLPEVLKQEYPLSKELQKAKLLRDQEIRRIPCAEGGSSIDDWSIEKILFKNAIIQAKFAMQNSNLIAILWHQGENDSYNGNYKT